MMDGASLERNVTHPYHWFRNRFSDKTQHLTIISNLALFQPGALSSPSRDFAWRDQCEVLVLALPYNFKAPVSRPGTRSFLGRISNISVTSCTYSISYLTIFHGDIGRCSFTSCSSDCVGRSAVALPKLLAAVPLFFRCYT